MPKATYFDLTSAFGSENVGKLASAYESAILHLTGGTLTHVVDHDTRLGIVTCLLAEARAGRFDPDLLRTRALSVAERLTSERGASSTGGR